jgi:hypothetical protein
MPITHSSSTVRLARRLFSGVLLAGLLAVLAPAASQAKITTFGSPLSVPATLNTSENLGYPGAYTNVPPAPDAPNGVFHTLHDGADTALWNVGLANGDPQVHATGQALKISLEGCAQAASNGPPPLTQIHFQDLSPLPGGGAKVNLSSQAFAIPICGQGADGSSVSTYEPTNLCVSAGDYVGFNDDGGYVPNVYRAGVPYQVLGSAKGSTLDSFLRDNGTGNGAILSSSDLSADDGFAVSHGEELMMQVKLGTGPDATHICAGGTQGLPAALAPIRVSPQTDGVSHSHLVSLEVFCRVTPECKGTVTLSTQGQTYGKRTFSLAPHKTMPLLIHVSSPLVNLLRNHRGKVHSLPAIVSLAVAGKTVTQEIGVEIPY